jgi:hypothetical protein
MAARPSAIRCGIHCEWLASPSDLHLDAVVENCPLNAQNAFPCPGAGRQVVASSSCSPAHDPSPTSQIATSHYWYSPA